MEYIKYLQIKFSHLGRGFTEGDCLNLIILFYQHELGIELPDKTDYPYDWKEQNYFLELHKDWGFRQVDMPEFGDVALFNGLGTDVVSHCGVVIGNHEFLHTSRHGTAIHQYIYGGWADKLYGFFRYKGQ
jgi:cell wall-associated NlpC family hydrolase